MESLYVISTLKKSKKNEYKAGRHTGTQAELISRYATYLINPIIFYFRPTNNATLIEKIFKKKMISHREININDNLTEWITLDLPSITTEFESIITEFRQYKILVKSSKVHHVPILIESRH